MLETFMRRLLRRVKKAGKVIIVGAEITSNEWI